MWFQAFEFAISCTVVKYIFLLLQSEQELVPVFFFCGQCNTGGMVRNIATGTRKSPGARVPGSKYPAGNTSYQQVGHYVLQCSIIPGVIHTVS